MPPLREHVQNRAHGESHPTATQKLIIDLVPRNRANGLQVTVILRLESAEWGYIVYLTKHSKKLTERRPPSYRNK